MGMGASETREAGGEKKGRRFLSPLLAAWLVWMVVWRV